MKLLLNSGLGIRQQIKAAATSEDLTNIVKEIATAQESGKLTGVHSKTQARWAKAEERRRKELS